MPTTVVHQASTGARDRRKRVEARLAGVAVPGAVKRSPPPEGRLGADDYAIPRLRDALVDLGPVFASFGRYLSSRIDLLSRRDAQQLATIPDRTEPMRAADVETCVARQLGLPIARSYFAFERNAVAATLWTERHPAWLAPGVPVMVTLVRPDADAWLRVDLPLLSLVGRIIDLPAETFEAAVDDFIVTLRRRLDQTQQAGACATLVADRASGGRFDAPVVYRDHCAPGVLTVEHPGGVSLADVVEDDGRTLDNTLVRADLAKRVTGAWLWQALNGRVVPFEFDADDIVAHDDRLVLIAGSFEPHSGNERARFLTYLNAVSADDPDAAAAWIVDTAAPGAAGRHEDELRRRMRQAVPFRDGEWSGDDRLAEHVLVQWRMAREAGWPLTPHHLRVYRGLQAVTLLAWQLSPVEDTLAGALQEERLYMGLAEARHLADPRTAIATLDRLLQDMVQLPQKLDDVLTLASEGRLRLKLAVPETDAAKHTRNRTVLLVATLVALTAMALLARQAAPAFGVGVERLAAVVVLLLGGWLLVAAARM